MSALRKNVAGQVVTFALVNATTGAALTGASCTVKVALDGTQSAAAGTTTELGSGQYKYAPTQAETDGASVGILITATNAVPVNLHMFTTSQDPTIAQTGDAYARLGAPAGASVSADVAAAKSDTAAIKAKTDNLPSDPADQSAVEAAITAAVVSAATIADAVWDEAASGHVSAGSTGLTLANLLKFWRNKVITDPSAGTFTLYDDDNTTVLFTGSLWENAAGTQPYRGQGSERRDRLT